MEIVGTKVINGRVVNVWKYTDEENAKLKQLAEEHKNKEDSTKSKLNKTTTSRKTNSRKSKSTK